MRRSFLRIFSGLALAILLIDPLTHLLTLLQVELARVKREADRHIADIRTEDGLVLLTFTLREARTKLRWEHPREFEYRRQMYDVVRTRTEGNHVHYWCWWDKEETRVKREMEALLLGKRSGLTGMHPELECRSLNAASQLFLPNEMQPSDPPFLFSRISAQGLHALPAPATRPQPPPPRIVRNHNNPSL